MKVSTALQLLTTVMSSGSQDGWPQSLDNDFSSHAERNVEAGVSLDVQTLQELSQSLYNDDMDSQHDDDWVETVIDITSSNDLTSSGEHAATVPVSNNDYTGTFFVDESITMDFSTMNSLATTDISTYRSLQDLTSSAEGINITAEDYTLAEDDFTQLSAFTSTSLSNTSTTISTVDLTSVGQFFAVDGNASIQQDTDTASTSNIPTTLWNLDLPLSTAASDDTVALCGGARNVKESLKNRLHSRNSVTSLCQESNDATGCSTGMCAGLSTRSLSSSSSSLTQSFEDDDAGDELTKSLEKREKNRLAAQKCRNKKRDKTDNLEKNVTRLEQRQERLKEEVKKLRDEKETLQSIVNIHEIVCPKVRKISNS